MVAFIFFLCVIFTAHAQKPDFINEGSAKFISNENYGEFERNKFDIILPADSAEHGLVIFIHGGGFVSGDKNNLYNRKDDVLYYLKNNIAVATVNYRYSVNNDSLGVRVCLRDVQHAIQHIKHNAGRYNIDKNRIGCYGISAGAGSSMYLAFHDDLAEPGDTTLLGESTRIKCAGAIDCQATYDVFAWKKIVPWLRLLMWIKHKFFFNMAANFYGYPDYKSFKPYHEETAKSLDLLAMIDEKDPPVYLMNLLDKSFPKNDYVIQHHRKHAMAVAKVADKNNVEHYLYTSKQAKDEKDIDFTIREFFVEKLKSRY